MGAYEKSTSKQVVPVLQREWPTVTPPSATTAVKLGDFDELGKITLAKGATVPGDEPGYAKGCIFIKTNTADGQHCVYWNIGNSTDANFVVNDAIVPTDLALATGKMFVGNGSGLAQAYNVAVNFTGDVLSGHTHTVTPTGTIAQSNATQSTNTKVLRLYTGTVTGTPQAGATLSQATSGATATVVSVGSGFLVVNTVVGTFDATHVVTGTNGDLSSFTFTPPFRLVDAWTLSPTAAWLYYATSNTAQALTQIGPTVTPTTNTFRQTDSATIETLDSDGWTSISAGYVALPVFTGASDTTSSVSAGTPSGTNAIVTS